jgi:hypothetical protein
MLAYLAIAFWGGITVVLLMGFLNFRGQVVEAIRKRDEAITLAAEAVQARQKTLEAYDKEVEKFKAHMSLPLIANMTDQQVEDLGNRLASKIFAANAAVNLTRTQ